MEYKALLNSGVFKEDIMKCDCGEYFNIFFGCENEECAMNSDVYILDLNMIDRDPYMSEYGYPEIKALEAEVLAAERKAGLSGKRPEYYSGARFDPEGVL